MEVRREDAEKPLRAAGQSLAGPEDDTPLSRVEICRRLMEVCLECDMQAPITWQDNFAAMGDSDLMLPLCIEKRFGITFPDTDVEIENFGALFLMVEGLYREQWAATQRTTTANCPTQTVFYDLRRLLRQTDDSLPKRLRPTTRLADCLPPETAEKTLLPLLSRRYGVFVELTDQRVFGRLPIGATWLALWFIAVLVSLFFCVDLPREYGFSWFLGLSVGTGISIALLLYHWSRPVWRRDMRTVADVVRAINSQIPERRADLLRAADV
jgi:hypothetical protein